MAGNDRSDLIKALGNAYKQDKDKGSGRVVSESTRFDGKSYARVIVQDGETETRAYFDYPEACCIKDFATLLKESKDTSAEDAARMLETKFLKAAAAKDEERINKMIELSRSMGTKLHGVSASNPQRVLFLMLAVEQIKKV